MLYSQERTLQTTHTEQLYSGWHVMDIWDDNAIHFSPGEGWMWNLRVDLWTEIISSLVQQHDIIPWSVYVKLYAYSQSLWCLFFPALTAFPPSIVLQNVYSVFPLIIAMCVGVSGRTVYSVSSYSRWQRDNPGKATAKWRWRDGRRKGEDGGGLCMDD